MSPSTPTQSETRVGSDQPQFGDPRLSERFWSKVLAVPSGCWEWSTAALRGGYGHLRFNDGYVSAHRHAYSVLVEAIPPGLTIDHLCRNRSCVRPDHMEVVTLRENILRSANPAAHNARKTRCLRGHVLPAYVEGVKRRCEVCVAELLRRRMTDPDYAARRRAGSTDRSRRRRDRLREENS